MKIPGISTERMAAIFARNSNIFQITEAFTVKAIANETGNLNRVGIITGKKKIGKSAVIRNRADRRIKAAIQVVYPDLGVKGYDFLIFSQPPVITLPWPTLVEQVRRSFKIMENKITPKQQRKQVKN